MKSVAVLVGAGASLDCANRAAASNSAWRPPLAAELFDVAGRPEFETVLRTYPGAHSLAADLAERAAQSTTSLEELLYHYSNHPNEATRTSFRDIPLYLAHLLQTVSERFTRLPGGYVRLVRGLLAESEHRVMFVVLNYDTLLEAALSAFDSGTYSFDRVHSYVDEARQAFVFKVHGSCNWVVEEALSGTEDPPVEILKGPLQPRSTLRPLLTVPVANKTMNDVVCPEYHRIVLLRELAKCKKLLVLGTSGLDNNVLKLLELGMPAVESMHLVGFGESAVETRDRLRLYYPRLVPRPNEVFSGGFREYLNDEAFQRFLRI